MAPITTPDHPKTPKSPPSTSFPPLLHRKDQSTDIRKQLAFYSALDKLVVESSLIMLALKELERDFEEEKLLKKKNGDARGEGKDDASWHGRLHALRERDWTMSSELERLKGEWGVLNGNAKG